MPSNPVDGFVHAIGLVSPLQRFGSEPGFSDAIKTYLSLIDLFLWIMCLNLMPRENSSRCFGHWHKT